VDPFVVLARASAVTKNLRLGTGIILVPERNPLVTAKEIATLDYLSGGRFLFGIGAGWHKEELEILGGNFSHRWTQTREAIEAMKELWTRDEAEYHGEYYDFPLVRSFPKPARKPHPPIYLGGNARNVFKRTVAYGNGWIPSGSDPEEVKRGRDTLNELAAKAGRDPGSIEVLAYAMYDSDLGMLSALEDAGVDGAVVRVDAEPEKEALAQLERIAQQAIA
jgi:probable F420-dependent oxidoreductase